MNSFLTPLVKEHLIQVLGYSIPKFVNRETARIVTKIRDTFPNCNESDAGHCRTLIKAIIDGEARR